MEPITLLLVDGEPSVLRGLRMRLELEADFRVLGEAYRSDDLERLAGEMQPDVVVLDLDVPGQHALALGLVRSLAPTQRIVALTLQDGPGVARLIANAGASALIQKQAPTSALVEAIRSVARDLISGLGEGGGAMQ